MSYDGDIDQQSSQDGRGGGVGLGLRATVDGNARRRSHSSDEEESVKELSTAQESHLMNYQQPTPMQPGQCHNNYNSVYAGLPIYMYILAKLSICFYILALAASLCWTEQPFYYAFTTCF